MSDAGEADACLSENHSPSRCSLADPAISGSPEDTAAKLSISRARPYCGIFNATGQGTVERIETEQCLGPDKPCSAQAPLPASRWKFKKLPTHSLS